MPSLTTLITAKPVLIGIHLGFAIIAIDLFLWLLGEVVSNGSSVLRRSKLAMAGILALAGSWLVGGYYYVVYYGPLVKPVIKGGQAPWAHSIAMEAKEHIFLFLIPMALTAYFALQSDIHAYRNPNIKSQTAVLVGLIAGLGLFIGLLGFVISAAARWGII